MLACEVEEAIDAYNAERVVDEWIWTPPLDSDEEAEFNEWFFGLAPEDRPGGFSPHDFAECTSVHTDGWLPATASIVGAAQNPGGFVVVNSEGPLGCTGHGEVLFGTALYYWWNGAWRATFGITWSENPQGGVIAEGDVTFACVDIIPGGAGDFANIQDSVPTAQVNLNPGLQGLTGLDTWLWYDFTQPEAAELTIPSILVSARGTDWTLSANVWVDQVQWDIDCESACTDRAMADEFDFSGYDYMLDLPDTFDVFGDPAVLAPASTYDGGEATASGAAVNHIYRTKDGYTVSTATVWRGFWEFQGITYPYAPVVVAEGVGYDVVEIRSVLVTPDA